MFQRQWFPINSQIGLSEEALSFENFLKLHQYEECRKKIKNNIYLEKEYWIRMRERLKHISKRKQNSKIFGKPPIYIFWHGFWPNMDFEDNQILDFFNEALPNQKFKSTSRVKKADIFLSSCFGKENLHKKFSHCLKFLFLGENVRPYYKDYDFTLTSDLNSYRGRNIYLPLWLLEIDIFNRKKNYSDRVVYDPINFCEGKIIDFSDRKKGIIYVGNNEEPLRKTLIYDLKKNVKEFYEYGSLTKPLNDKINLLKSYKGTLALENSYYPGYVTEKAMHSYIAGTKTIYWGCLQNSFIKNNSLFINISSSINSEEINKIAQNILKLENKEYVEPLLSRKLIFKHKRTIVETLRKILNQFLL